MRPAAVLVGIVLTAASVFLAACGTLEQPHPVSADPRSLVLSAADLPGWQADASNTRPLINPRDMTGDSSATSPYTENGWVSAYEADYTSASATGDQRIAVLVSVFRNPDGASAFIGQGVGSQDLPPWAQPLAEPPSLGERSKAYRQQVTTSTGNLTTLWAFYWQDRNIVARVHVVGEAVGETVAVGFARREAQIVRDH